MSAITGKVTQLVSFYRSSALPCPYILGQLERKLFTRLPGQDVDNLNGSLTVGGFRRSHEFVYRPICDHCSACKPVRIRAEAFAPSRNVRRLFKKNADLVMREAPCVPTSEQYRLFARYQARRHGDGDMASMGPEDYAAMIREGSEHSSLMEWRLGEALVAVILIDHVEGGISAVYSFFDPALPERSLGRHMVNALAQWARDSGLRHVYLGYWIAQSRKMAYKAEFQPLEVLEGGHWIPFEGSMAQHESQGIETR